MFQGILAYNNNSSIYRLVLRIVQILTRFHPVLQTSLTLDLSVMIRLSAILYLLDQHISDSFGTLLCDAFTLSPFLPEKHTP